MVAWEKQLDERCVPKWRDKYVAYARLKRKLDRLKPVQAEGDVVHYLSLDGNELGSKVDSVSKVMSGKLGASATSLSSKTEREQSLLESQEQLQDEFITEVHKELGRVSSWYQQALNVLESRVRPLTSAADKAPAGAAALGGLLDSQWNEIEQLHLEAVQLTEFALMNSEALRKIVKKMDKKCNTNYQKEFVNTHLKKSPLATTAADGSVSFDGERARRCRRALEQIVSPERMAELRSKAMEAGSVGGLSKRSFSARRTIVSLLLAAGALPLAMRMLPGVPRAQRCVALVTFTVAMWIMEAAPFEATAMLVPPLAVLLSVLEGTKDEQASQVLAAVFNESLYLVLSGFAISSVFSRCQLDSRAASVLQQWLGERPFSFLLAFMFLGLGLSGLLSNVTAPLLLVEVLKPLIRDLPTDNRFSRALLMGLAFSCNIGGMITPISSPQNVAALQTLRQGGGDISWGQWLSVSVPLCAVAVLAAWALLLLVYRWDRSAEEAARDAVAAAGERLRIPPVVFERQDFSAGKLAALLGASGTLAGFACAPVAAAFGGTPMVALTFVSLALGSGAISRQTFNSYSWHLLFLIGGGSALGLSVRESGLLDILTTAIKRQLATSPWALVIELVAVLIGATTFVSHTVAALVLMPLVVELGTEAGISQIAVLVGAFACSAACALPMTSFPNVNSLMAVDDNQKPWLSMRHFLVAGTPMTLIMGVLLVTLGFWLANLVFS